MFSAVIAVWVAVAPYPSQSNIYLSDVENLNVEWMQLEKHQPISPVMPESDIIESADFAEFEAQEVTLLEGLNRAPLETPGVCIIVNGLGLDKALLTELHKSLPQKINFSTLSFADVSDIMEGINLDGREYLIEVPMEPLNYPAEDPGPGLLLTGVAPAENYKRLQVAVNKYNSAIGLMNYRGSRLISVRVDLVPIVSWIKKHDMIFVDAGETARSQVDEVSLVLKSKMLNTDEIFRINDDAAELDTFLQGQIDSALESGLKVVRIEISPKNLKALIDFTQKPSSAKIKYFSLTEAYQHLNNSSFREKKSEKSLPSEETQDTFKSNSSEQKRNQVVAQSHS